MVGTRSSTATSSTRYSRPAVVFGYEGRSKQNGGNYDPKAFDDLLKRLRNNDNKSDLSILEVVDTATYMDYTYDFDLNFDTNTTNNINRGNTAAGGEATAPSATTGTTTGNDAGYENNNNNNNTNKVIPNMIRDNEKAFSAALQANTSILTVTVDLKLPPQQRQQQRQQRVVEAETETTDGGDTDDHTTEEEGGGDGGDTEEDTNDTEATRDNSNTDDDHDDEDDTENEARKDSNTTTTDIIEDEYHRISKFVAHSIGQLQSLRDLTVHVYDDLKGFDTIALLLNNVKTTISLTVYCACNNNSSTTGTIQRMRDAVTANDNGGVLVAVGEDNSDADDPTTVVVQALREHPNLKSLTVHCDDPYLFRPFISAVPAMPAIEKIDLSYDGGRRGTMLRIRDLCTVCFGSSTVKEVTLTDFTFGSHHNYVLAEAMASEGLTSMKIYGYQTNHTVAENCEMICDNLATNTTLQKFHFLVPSDDDLRFCRALGRALIRNTSLTELTLDGEIKDAAFTEICYAVGHENNKLKRLKLEGCNVSSSQAAVDGVSTLLENNNSLVELEIEIADLSVCADTLVACISAIQQNTVMKRLDVVGRPVFIEYEKPVLTLDQAKVACKAIQKNFSLTHCSKFRIKRSRGETKKERASIRATVAALLKLNRCGRRYLLDESASKNRGLSVLALVSNDPDCVYTHLLENPSLCDPRKWIRTRRKRNATKINKKKNRGTKIIRTNKEPM